MILRARHDSHWRDCWQANGGHCKHWNWLCGHQAWDWLESLPLLYQHPEEIIFQGRRYHLIASHATVNRQYNWTIKKRRTFSGGGRWLATAMTPYVSTATLFKQGVYLSCRVRRRGLC